MAKKKAAPKKETADLTPEQKLAADWPAKHKQLAPYITELGRIRTGLKPSAIEKAKDILKNYGF
ncbi:MAG: hypothetical protein AMJ65_07205 [Phycisphaerae bacterium SG8_4]|nr:MAG: hypothetical protein AMJ65_07205 [Phycisphaerae bacterium SG8_4]